jgi:hypothetical protein
MDGEIPIGRISTVPTLIVPATPSPDPPVVSVPLSPPPSVSPIVLLMDILLVWWIFARLFN